MKKFTLFASALAIAFSASAAVHSVDSISGYPLAYAAALDGDTVLLHEGTYQNQKFPVGKVITVMGAEGEDVYLNGEITCDQNTDINNGGIVFENLVIGNGASYLFNFAPAGTVAKIALKNCVLENVSRCTIYLTGTNGAVLKDLVFDHTVIRNVNTGNWNFMWPEVPIEKITFNECTVYESNGMESIYLPRTAYAGSHEFIFTHNTYYTGCRDANRNLCDVGNKFAGTDCRLVITDNIIVAPEGKAAGKLFNIGSGYWEGAVTNNLLVGWVCPAFNDELGDVTVENNYHLEDLGVASATALFADAANADFTHFKGYSVLEGKGTEGSVLGAQAWLIDGGTLYTLTSALAEGVPAEAGSISGPSGSVQGGKEVTLTAVKNYGYAFSKWVDASGNTLSTDAVYTFTVNADTKVYAVFEAMNMYTLTINCVGGGNYTISEAGANGEYVSYEEGTELVISSVTNRITEFIMASDQDGNFYFNTEFTVTMNKDMTLSLEFEMKDFIGGWDQFTDNYTGSIDFTVGGSTTNGRIPDYVSPYYLQNTLNADSSNLPRMEMYYTLYPDAPWEGWWNFSGSALIWKRCNANGSTDMFDNDSTKFYDDQGYFYQYAFSTKNYLSDAVISFNMKNSYRSYNTYTTQFSYNGTSWENLKTITVGGGFNNYVDTIPLSSDKEMIYYRIYPSLDPSDYNHGCYFDTYGLYIDDIFIEAEYNPALISALNKPETEAKETLIYDIMGRRVTDMDRPGLYIVNGKKYMVK